jgi:hypothetical protein
MPGEGLRASRRQEQAVDRYVVVVTLPEASERSTQTCTGPVVVGRGSGATLRLPHPLVSPRHFEIVPGEEGRYVVRDLGSRNGTVVNGALLRDAEVVVSTEARIEVGPYCVTLRPAAEEPGWTPADAGGRRLVLDREGRRLLVDRGLGIARLSPQEFLLIRILDDEYPETVPSHMLGDVIWGEGRWDAYMLHNLVRRVRRKLEAQRADASGLLLTVPGLGYRIS